jgi:hypothetical protein
MFLNKITNIITQKFSRWLSGAESAPLTSIFLIMVDIFGLSFGSGTSIVFLAFVGSGEL